MNTPPNDPASSGAGNGENGAGRDESIAERLEAEASGTIDEAEQRAQEFEDALRERAAESEQAAVGDNIEKLRAYVQQNPLTSAGLAFVAGLVISSFIRGK